MTNHTERTVVITGGTGGIGFQSAIGIAKTGATVLITGRNRERGDDAVKHIIAETGNNNVELVVGDVSTISDTDKLAHDIVERSDHIDVLVNNAGYLGNKPKSSPDGLEMHFAVNVLAPWRLTIALLPALRAGDDARVLNITGGVKPAAIDPDNLQAEKGFQGLTTYAHSKSATEAMSMALADKLQPEGVTVNVIFPGRASTAMTGSMSPSALPGLMKLMYPLFRLMFRDDGGKSAKKAARSTIWAATTPDLEGVTGRYFDTNSKEQKLDPTAYDPQVQNRILATIETSASPPSP
jgi:NAD(P)-dependent dehydrogenase (short-subunit alcohol dehydrogenase family)